MINPADIATLLNDRIAPMAVGKLIGELELLKLASVFPDPEPSETANVYRVPKMGAGTPAVRAPGGSVVDSNTATTKVDIVATEIYESRVFDRQTLAALNPSKLAWHAEDMLKDIVEKANSDAMVAVIGTAGIGSFGVVGTAVSATVMRALKKYFVDNMAPQSNRILAGSSELTTNLFADADYKPAFQFNSAIIEGKFPRIEQFNVFESVYTQSIVGPPAGHKNISFHRDAVVQIFPDPTLGLDAVPGATYGSADIDGVRIAFKWEAIPGTNGGARIAAWIMHGVGVTRPGHVAVLNGQ